MSYLVLARKYRPQKFSDLTGQETISAILKSAILQDRVAHAYLFSGPRGIGKTTSARIFAKALNCKKRSAEGEPCDTCESCEAITKGNSLDVLEIDAASHTGIDATREVIIESVAFAPVSGKHKIFIIDEVHMLSNHSFNALLKTLEEPPAHIVFILATTDFHKIPTTIASRCQRFRFLPMTPKEIISNLKKIAQIEKISVSEDALAILARAAGGAMRDALSLFDQVISSVSGPGQSAKIERETVEGILGVVKDDFLNRFLNLVADKNPKGVLESVRQALNEGYDLSHFLKELRESYRQMLIQKCGYGGDDPYLDIRPGLPVERFSKEKILRDIQLLTRCADLLRWNDLPHVVFESYAVRLCDDALGADELLERIKNLEDSLKGGGPIQSAPRPAGPFAAQTAPSAAQSASSSVQSAQAAPKAASPSVSKFTAAAESKPAAPVSKASSVSSTVSIGEASGSVSVPAISSAAPSPSAPSALGDAWKKTLAGVHQSKASLHTFLLSASVQLSDDKIEITFYTALGLDSVRRNVGIIEDLLSREAGRRVPLVLKLGNPEDKPRVRDNEVTVSSDGSDSAGDSGSEAFESSEGDSDSASDLFAAQDAGVKKFMQLFPGKVTAPGEPA